MFRNPWLLNGHIRRFPSGYRPLMLEK
jgi:hypothetical protein